MKNYSKEISVALAAVPKRICNRTTLFPEDYDEIYLDLDIGAILCQSYHDRYHGNYFPIQKKTFKEFVNNKKPINFQNKKFSFRKNKKRKKTKQYKLKK